LVRDNQLTSCVGVTLRDNDTSTNLFVF